MRWRYDPTNPYDAIELVYGRPRRWALTLALRAARRRLRTWRRRC